MKHSDHTIYLSLLDCQAARILSVGLNSLSLDVLREWLLIYLSIDLSKEELSDLHKISMEDICSAYGFEVIKTSYPVCEDMTHILEQEHS